MSQFRDTIKRSDQHIKSLRITCAFLVLLVLITSTGWMLAPRSMIIHSPPDLRIDSTRPWWEVPPSSVYAFAFYIFQQLNAGPKNGEPDCPAMIRALSAYLTSVCKDLLEQE